MKVIPLEQTGDNFKVLFQDDKTKKGFVIGLSGTLTSLWNLNSEQEVVNYLRTVAEKILKIRGFDYLNDREMIFTTKSLNLDKELAINEIVRIFCKEKD